MSDRRRGLVLVGAVGLVLVAVPTLVAATSNTVTDISAVAQVGTGVILTMTVALLLWTRPPDRRIAAMLVVLAAAYAVRGLAASDLAWLFTLSRALGQVAEAVLVWVVLAFPSGRLRSRTDRVVLAASVVTTTVLWLPVLVYSPEVPLPGPLVPCQHDCPENLLFLADRAAIADAFQTAFRAAGVLVLVAVAGSLVRRLLGASPVVRRTLAPLLVVSIVRVLAIAVFVASGGSWLSGVVLTATFWALPIAIALGLLLARLYTARALLRLVSGLERRPDTGTLRAVMADALDDPALEIVYWLPDQRRWVDAAGNLDPGQPAPPPGRAVRVVTSAQGPLAAIVHDELLLEDPALLEAVTASARMAMESNQALADLAASDARAADAESRARRDLERDLHDGAQQRLIALRMKVSVLRRLLDKDVRRAAELAGQLGGDIEATLDEVRGIARGAWAPRLLAAEGLAAALAGLAADASVPTALSTGRVRRYDRTIESAVYFTCSEAVQNAAKHAGPAARVVISLSDEGDCLRFEIRDDGPGADPSTVTAGQGLANMRERIASCGGRLDIVAAPDVGFTLRGDVPLNFASR